MKAQETPPSFMAKILGTVLQGAATWIDLPLVTTFSLRVVKMSEMRAPGSRQATHRRIILEMSHEEFPGKSYPVCITINLRTRRIDWLYTTPGPFGKSDWRNRNAGLLAFPILFPFLGTLLAIRAAYAFREHLHGVSRHGEALLDLLEEQLDHETDQLLRQALRNTWEYERTVSQRPSFRAARALLDRCTLEEDAEGLASLFTDNGINLTWHDAAGNVIASAYADGNGIVRSLQVLGSYFADDQASMLSRHYYSRRTTSHKDHLHL